MVSLLLKWALLHSPLWWHGGNRFNSSISHHTNVSINWVTLWPADQSVVPTLLLLSRRNDSVYACMLSLVKGNNKGNSTVFHKQKESLTGVPPVTFHTTLVSCSNHWFCCGICTLDYEHSLIFLRDSWVEERMWKSPGDSFFLAATRHVSSRWFLHAFSHLTIPEKNEGLLIV